MRRLFTVLGIVVVLFAGAAPPARADAVAVVVIDGKGFGHGVGMAQEGAFAMGVDGAKVGQILAQFYPGTGLGKAKGPVRIPLLDAGPAPSSGVLAFPDGGVLLENGGGPASPGFPINVAPGGAVRVVWDGRVYRVEGAAGGAVALGPIQLTATYHQVPTLPTTPPDPTPATTTTSTTTTTTAPTSPPTTAAPSGSGGGGGGGTTTTQPPAAAPTAPPPSEQQPAPGSGGGTGTGGSGDAGGPTSSRSVVAVANNNGSVAVPSRQRRYRGTIEATAASGRLRFINSVDVEQYLKGMGEVRDPSWPPAALQAQATAARTYAMRAMANGGEICDTERCQVYLGAQAEYPAMNAAVDATAQQVLTYDNALASAVYSANGGGFSASREEGFGVADAGVPYLRAAPYPTKDPGAWSVTVALTDVAARFGYGGQLTGVRVARTGPSGRALEVVLDGSVGPKSVAGIAFDAALGLRSTLFTVRIDAGEAPPPPPAAEAVPVQAPPDEAAAVAQTEVAQAATTVPRPARGRIGSKAGRHGRKSGIDPRLLVVASWLATAAAGAGYLGLSPGWKPWSRRRPSPSAPQTEGGSP